MKETNPGMLGVIGGLGPIATAYFMELVIKMTRAECDQQHLDMIIYNIPSTPDRTAFLLGKAEGKDGARQLRRLVQSEVEGPLASFLLGCSRKPGKVKLRLEEGTVSFCS